MPLSMKVIILVLHFLLITLLCTVTTCYMQLHSVPEVIFSENSDV